MAGHMHNGKDIPGAKPPPEEEVHLWTVDQVPCQEEVKGAHDCGWHQSCERLTVVMNILPGRGMVRKDVGFRTISAEVY